MHYRPPCSRCWWTVFSPSWNALSDQRTFVRGNRRALSVNPRDGARRKEEPPRKMGLASSAGAFPLVMIDDSVRCAAPECSHANPLALVERVRRRCLAARETSVVSSDLTTRISIRTFEMPRFSDVSLETHPLSQTRHGSGRRIYLDRLARQEKPFDNIFLNNPLGFRGKICGELSRISRFFLRTATSGGGLSVIQKMEESRCAPSP